MFGSDDLSPFFDAEDGGAVSCVRTRPGDADVPFLGILGTADDEGFDGQATVRTHALHYAAAAVDLRAGDTVATPDAAWRVLRLPERLNDGAEARAWLQRIT